MGIGLFPAINGALAHVYLSSPLPSDRQRFYWALGAFWSSLIDPSGTRP